MKKLSNCWFCQRHNALICSIHLGKTTILNCTFDFQKLRRHSYCNFFFTRFLDFVVSFTWFKKGIISVSQYWSMGMVSGLKSGSNWCRSLSTLNLQSNIQQPPPQPSLWPSLLQSNKRANILLYFTQELQWRQAPPCSSWDTGRVAPLLLSPSDICLN